MQVCTSGNIVSPFISINRHSLLTSSHDIPYSSSRLWLILLWSSLWWSSVLLGWLFNPCPYKIHVLSTLILSFYECSEYHLLPSELNYIMTKWDHFVDTDLCNDSSELLRYEINMAQFLLAWLYINTLVEWFLGESVIEHRCIQSCQWNNKIYAVVDFPCKLVWYLFDRNFSSEALRP